MLLNHTPCCTLFAHVWWQWQPCRRWTSFPESNSALGLGVAVSLPYGATPAMIFFSSFPKIPLKDFPKEVNTFIHKMFYASSMHAQSKKKLKRFLIKRSHSRRLQLWGLRGSLWNIINTTVFWDALQFYFLPQPHANCWKDWWICPKYLPHQTSGICNSIISDNDVCVLCLWTSLLERMQTKLRKIIIGHCFPLTPMWKLLYQLWKQGLTKLGLPDIVGRSKWAGIWRRLVQGDTVSRFGWSKDLDNEIWEP